MMGGYYTSQKSKLLKEFDQAVTRVKGLFVSRYGEDTASGMVEQTRREYETLLPQLPYIGGKQPHTQFIISTGWFLAVYRVLKSHGGTLEEAGTLVYELSEAYLQAYPGFLRRFFGYMTFSGRYMRGVRKRAAESQEHRYPGDYVYTYVEGDGKGFHYGVDYSECAGWNFLRQQGAAELAPYLCAVDKLYSEALGWGLVRTMTLAEGCEKCDFRFKKGGETRVSIPEALRRNTR